MTAMTLGPVTFESFEVPNRIEFGGKQRLAVHVLPGGPRVVDALGPDDAPVIWSGIFTGPEAPQRVRHLDLLRASGEPLILAWDDFVYKVVITAFEARFDRTNWIPYRISCLVLANSTWPQSRAPSAAAQIGSDVGFAASCPGLDVSAAQAALAFATATTRGTSAYGEAGSALAGAVLAAAELLGSGADALAGATTVADAVSAAARLAQASAAQNYLRRAQANFSRAGS